MKNTKTVTNEVNKPKKPIKKSIIIALILIAALVPTILGVASYIINTKNILDTDEMSVSLFYKGKLLKEATDDPKDQNADLLVHLFDSIIYKMEKLDSPPEILSENTPYTLRIATSNSTNDYVCHFNLTGDSYFVDSSQNVYKIDKENAEVFLTSEFAEILYVNAIPPKLYSSSDEIISPTSHKWNYKNVKGEFVEAAEIKKSESVSEYNMSGSLGLDFDSFPDKCFVKVLKSGIYVYEGDINELSSFFVEPGATLQFEVEATWNQKEDTDYHGVVNYSFKAIVRDRAEFHLDKHEVTNGDYILASCVNVLDSSKIEFYSVPDIKCEPIFFNDNGIVRTLIPFSQDLEAGEYKLFFSYGATEESLSIVLNEPEAPKKYIMKPENIPLLSNLINEKNIKEIDSIIYSLEYDKNIYLRNSFIDIVIRLQTIHFVLQFIIFIVHTPPL